MVGYKVTFEGESSSVEDDKSVVFNEIQSNVSIPEDFMPKMFEYLESDEPYDVLYQIKSLSKDGSELDSKEYVSIIAEYNDGSKGGLLLKDEEGLLKLIGIWDIDKVNDLVNDVYANPDKFELVVVTIAESMAP